MLPEGLEQDTRVAAPDVEDVGADAQRIDQADRLLEEVAQGQDGDDPVVERRQDVVDRLERREEVVVGDHDALRGAGGARREDQVPDILGTRPLPRVELGLPVGREGRGIGFGREGIDGRRRKILQAGRCGIRRVATRAEDQVAWLGAAEDPGDRVRAHLEVEGDQDQPGAHRPEVGGRQLRARWRPGQDPVARLQSELMAEPPGGQPAAPVELAIGPGRARTVVVPQPDRRPIRISPEGAIEKIQKGCRFAMRHARLVHRSRW